MITDWQPGVLDPGRLGAVRRSGLIDMERNDAFDRLLELATELTGAPRACITLVDSTHTRALSALGFPQELVLVAPIELSFCRFVVATGAPLVVEDSRRDPRTAGDPTIEAFDAGAWVGYPIEDADGRVLGTMCLMDSDPHEWTTQDLHALSTLAMAVSTEIALRQVRVQATAMQWEIDQLRAASSR